MEILLTAISIFGIIVIAIVPFIIFSRVTRLNLRFPFLTYLTIAILISFILIGALAWWSNIKTDLLLSHYGYDFEAMNDPEKISGVSVENLERVSKLEIGRLGIGWPLKAIMAYPFYCPYLVLTYVIIYLLKKIN